MMCSNNCVEVLGKSVGWEVRGQLYKHYIITVPNSNLLKLETGLAKYATSVFPVVHLIFWHSVVGCFEISHFLCELPSCWSVRLSLESPCFQAFFFIMEPQAKRFAGVCDSDVDQVIAGRVPQATKEATSGWLRVFHHLADKQETRLN